MRGGGGGFRGTSLGSGGGGFRRMGQGRGGLHGGGFREEVALEASIGCEASVATDDFQAGIGAMAVEEDMVGVTLADTFAVVLGIGAIPDSGIVPFTSSPSALSTSTTRTIACRKPRDASTRMEMRWSVITSNTLGDHSG